MSVINDIKTQIKETIEAHVDKVQEVANFDKQPVGGFPLVCITMSESENEFYSTANNMRTYIIKLVIYDQMSVNVSNPTPSVWNTAAERAESNLCDVVSDILSVLDKHYTLDDTVDYVEATPSAWGYLEVENGWCRTAEILLRVKKQFDVTI